VATDAKPTVMGFPEALHLTLPKPYASGLKPGMEFASLLSGPEALFFVRDGLKLTGFFSGSLSSLSLPELFQHVLSGIRSGKLIVTNGSIRKTVAFRDGQVIFGSSSEPHERLGASMVRSGLITAEQLKAALAEVKGQVKLGQVLTRSGVVTASGLYTAMTALVRDIVLDLFTLPEGSFLFLEGFPHTEDLLKLPERTKDLVLEGIKRGDEVARLRAKWPMTLRVSKAEGTPPAEAEELWETSEGASLTELRKAFAGTDFTFYSQVEALFAAKAWVKAPELPAPMPVKPPEPTQPLSALELYAALIQTICSALKSAGGDLEDLKSFFTEPLPNMEKWVAGLELSDDGRIDVSRLLANVQGKGAAIGKLRAYEVLESFVSYALFSAKNALPEELAELLQREFRQIREGLSE
jgi:hypothetical protein